MNWHYYQLSHSNIFPNSGLCFSLIFKVSEMKAEYFPPKEDVILQNEAPTDFYVLVSGAVVIIDLSSFNLL